jgi:hypothetical protein
MTGIEEDRLNYALSKRNYSYVLFDSDPKLVLTPLSAITDEHAIEVAKIAIGSVCRGPFTVERTGSKVGVSVHYGTSKHTFYISPPENNDQHGREHFYVYIATDEGYGISVFGTAKIIDLLRKYRYDCDNAISEGWAVDKTTFDNSNK